MTTTRAGTDAAGGSGDPVALSEAYLRAVRTGDRLEPHERALRDLSARRLRALGDEGDAARKAFWINVYNAAAQAVLAAAPEQYDDRRRFFGAPIVAVAGHRRSLDGVEHGLLRRSRPEWGLGYLRNPFPDAFERTHRVGRVDPRVHFALNCGAVSCPPIAAYSRDVEAELDVAARGYLEATVEYDPDAGVVRVPRVMVWYVGDFGGPAGVRDVLHEHGLVPGDARPRVRPLAWDWSLSRGDYRSESSGRRVSGDE